MTEQMDERSVERPLRHPIAWALRHPKLIRYASVSAIATTTSLVTLGMLVGVAGAPAVWSNVAATAVGTVPSFELNRRWVWRSSSRRSLHRQVVPFTILSFAGLALSTLTVHLAAVSTSGWSDLARTAAVEVANVATYGTLWVLQFFLLDRMLFRGCAQGGPAARVASTTSSRSPVMTS